MALRVIGAEGPPFKAENDVFRDRNLTIMILYRLSPKAMGEAMLTCQAWRDLVKGDNVLYGSLIMGCVQKFDLRVTSHQKRNLISQFVVMHLLRGDFCRAHNMVAKLKEPLVRSQAFIFGASEVKAQMPESPSVLAILKQAKKYLNSLSDSTSFPDPDKEEKLCMIAKMQAVYDTSTALKTCELIQRSNLPDHPGGMIVMHEYRDLAMLEIIKNMAGADPVKAKEQIKEVSIPENKILAFCHIARYCPEWRPQLLKGATDLLSQVLFPYRKDNVLIEIAKLQVLDDPDAAADTITQLSEFFSDQLSEFFSDQIDILAQIVKALYQKNPQRAKAWAANIKNLDFRVEAQIEIAVLECDLQVVSELIRQNILDEQRRHILIKVAKLDRSFLDQARLFTFLVQDEYDKILLLIEIAKLDRSYFDVVKQTALNSNSPDNLLDEIAKAQAALGDTDGAKKTIELMKIPDKKAQTLFKIAEIDPAHDLRAVQAAVIAMEDSYSQVEVICNISKALMRNFARVEEVYDF
jgi:hypothetical protein